MPQDTFAEINELVETSTLPVGLGVPTGADRLSSLTTPAGRGGRRSW